MKILQLAFFGLLLISSCKDDTIDVTSIVIIPSSPDVAAGGARQLTAIVNPANASNPAIIWISSNPEKATVNADGLVTGVDKGTATIIAVATDGSNVQGRVTIDITVKVASIAIKPAEPVVGVGGSLTLAAEVLPAEANQAVTWTSSDPTKAAIDPATGIVTGVALGSAVITAAAADGGDIKGTVTVNVIVLKAASISLTPSSPSVAVGFTQQLTAVIEPAGATKKELVWTSNNTLKATVNASGLVTGVSKGTAVITAAATDGSDIKGTVTINVTLRVASITVMPADPSVIVGGNFTLTAAALPAEAAQAVTWTSSDPTRAAIDAAAGTVRGVATGTAVITATATDGSGITGTATLTVRGSGSPEASVSAITLGDENLIVPVPAEGATAVLTHVPHTVASDIRRVKVNIRAAAYSTIKIGTTAFNSGDLVNFTNPVTFTVTAQDGTTVKNYSVNIMPYNKDTNPYGIYTLKHLVGVANGLTVSYLLKNDITLPNADGAGAAATGISDYASAGWRPFGLFTGTFDGGNFSINNFYVERTAEKVGLFGAVGANGIIKNLGVNGVSEKAAAGTSNGRYQYTGILAGSSEGTIDKCHVAGNVSFSFYGASYAGGLVGDNNGTISNSHAEGNVSASSSSSSYYSSYHYVGGLAGNNYGGSISNSYATGSVSSSSPSSSYVGGLVGYNDRGAVSNSHATGNVSSSSSSSYAGGLVGYSTNSNSRISNSYASGSVSSSSSSGGLVGYNDGCSISNSYATGIVSSRSYSGGLVGSSKGGSISNSYATGGVSSSSSPAGGLVGNNEGSRISNSYATGNVSSSSDSYSPVGGLAGRNDNGRYTNCYRNSDAIIKRDSRSAVPSDESTAGITAKTKIEMKTDAFKDNLNGTSGTAWGRSETKNDKLPYIIGVGVGK